MARVSIKEFLDINENKDNVLKLLRLTGLVGLENRFIESTEVNRPGMALFEYYENFASGRMQIFGRGESSYVEELSKNNNTAVFEKLFSYGIPVSVFTHNHTPNDIFIKTSLSASTPLLVTSLSSGTFINRFSVLLEDEFAQTTVVHGVFIDVLGVGILIKGSSGVGKSEATLELISKGHRLIADDSVELKKLSDGLVIGRTNKNLAHYMEVRGIGIVDISRIAGMSGVRDRKRLDLVIELSYWSESDDDHYDRTGLNDMKESVMGVEIPYLKIPVKSGRTLSTLIETAAKNHRLKGMGYNSAKEFNKRMIESLQVGKADDKR